MPDATGNTTAAERIAKALADNGSIRGWKGIDGEILHVNVVPTDIVQACNTAKSLPSWRSLSAEVQETIDALFVGCTRCQKRKIVAIKADQAFDIVDAATPAAQSPVATKPALPATPAIPPAP